MLFTYCILCQVQPETASRTRATLWKAVHYACDCCGLTMSVVVVVVVVVVVIVVVVVGVGVVVVVGVGVVTLSL
jgi:hypothetical protein